MWSTFEPYPRFQALTIPYTTLLMYAKGLSEYLELEENAEAKAFWSTPMGEEEPRPIPREDVEEGGTEDSAQEGGKTDKGKEIATNPIAKKSTKTSAKPAGEAKKRKATTTSENKKKASTTENKKRKTMKGKKNIKGGKIAEGKKPTQKR
jgi:hypothetical protein